MSKWIAEFELEDGDTMPEHMDLNYMGAKIDFHCRPKPKTDVLGKIRAEIADLDDADYDYEGYYKAVTDALKIIDKYKAESEEKDADSN